MCGRFAFAGGLKKLIEFFLLPALPVFSPRYNIAPSQPVLVIINDNVGNKTWDFLNWGLVPHWAGDPKIGSKMINARSETVLEKPAFKDAVRYRRCLIPASGFYEWKSRKGNKIPTYFYPTKDLFLFAGIWEVWTGKGGEEIRSFSILTKSAVSPISEIHHRMPIVLNYEEAETWLGPTSQGKEIRNLIKSFKGSKIASYEVSTLVNNPRNDFPECIEPKKEMQPGLF